MSDPLALLRSFVCNKRQIKVYENYICFDDIAFEKSTPTNYTMFKGKVGEPNEKNDYYTIETLYFFTQHQDLKYTAYLQKTTSEGVAAIRFPDRKDLLQLFTNLTATSTNIDKTAPISTSFSTQKITNEWYDKGGNRKGDAIFDDANNDSTMETGKATISSGGIFNKGSNLTGLSESAHLNDIVGDIIDETGLTIGGTVQESGTTDNDQTVGCHRKISRKDIDDLFISTLNRMLDNEQDFYLIDSNKKVVEHMIDQSYRVSRLNDKIIKVDNQYEQFDKLVFKNDLTFMQSSLKNLSEVLSYLEPKQPKQMDSPSKDKINNAKKHPLYPNISTNMTTMTKARSYSRYDQEKFRYDEDTAGFKINVLGSFQGLKKSKAIPNLNTSNSSFNDPGNIYTPPVNSNAHPSLKHTNNNEVSHSGSQHKYESRTPIIIVPTVSNTLVNMSNVRSFLEEYLYIYASSKKPNSSKDGEISIQRKKQITVDGKSQVVTIPYRCVSNISKLKPHEWEKVVAVFVHGPAWQFKGWPWLGPNNDPNDIFLRAQGFHLAFQNESIDSNVKKWNIECLTISKNKRYLDKASVIKFWKILDKFIVTHKKPVKF